MPTYLSPGVYVEEVDRGTKPIEAAGTSMASFVGISAEAGVKAIDPFTGQLITLESRLNKPTLVTSWTQYTSIFGGFVSGAYMPDAVYGYFANGGGPCYVTSIRAVSEASGDDVKTASVAVTGAKGKSFTVVAKVAGEAGNNVSVSIVSDKDDKGKPTDTFAMTVNGETKTGLNLKKGDPHFVGDATFTAASISDVGSSVPNEGSYALSGGGMRPLDAGDFVGDASKRTGINGLEAFEDIRLVACPDVFYGYDGSDAAKERVKSVQKAMIDHCELMRYRFAVIDTPPGLNAQEAKDWRYYVNFDSSYAALYYPWVQVADLEKGGTKFVPPSGHVVGVYNRVDAERGVHKAPANEIVRTAVGLELVLSRGEQDTLNPLGVNCIRSFPGRGIRIWGARTMSSDGSWRYLTVRRLFIMVAASMDTGLQWVVFEPNDSDLWARVRRDVHSFMGNVWRSGALFGARDQAYYVKCDEELNPASVRDLGQLIIEVGMAPVKPAEFVIFRLSQWAGANAEG